MGTALPWDKAPCLEERSYPLPFPVLSCLEVGAESGGTAELSWAGGTGSGCALVYELGE